jgi:hypothetical protein
VIFDSTTACASFANILNHFRVSFSPFLKNKWGDRNWTGFSASGVSDVVAPTATGRGPSYREWGPRVSIPFEQRGRKGWEGQEFRVIAVQVPGIFLYSSLAGSR